MKILITGGAGFIGSELCKQLLAQDHSVVVYDRFYFVQDIFDGLLSNENLRIIKGDIRQIQAEQLVGIDAVVDMAGLSNDPSGDLNPAWTDEINHLGRLRVATLSKAMGVSRYILASSCSVYGGQMDGVVNELSICNPLTAYAKANLDAENDILKLRDENFCVTVLRQATVFGKSDRMRFDLVVNLMTLNAFSKRQIFIMGGGSQWRPLVHVADVAQAFGLVLCAEPNSVSGEIFNIGMNNFKVSEIAYEVRASLPFEISIELLQEDLDKRSYSVDFSKAKSALNFQAKNNINYGVTEIYEGLKSGRIHESLTTKTVAWYQHLMNARNLLNRIQIDGKILEG